MAQEENAPTAPATLVLRRIAAAIAVAMSVYHMWVAGFGPPEAMHFRGTHLLFALTLVFLLFPLRPGGPTWVRLLDAVLLLLGWGAVLHIFINYQTFTNRIIYIDELSVWDKFYGVVAVLVVLEGTRRVIGWALPLTAVVFVAYAALFTQVKFPVLLEQLYFSTEGIFGSTLGVSASYVMLFVLFGAFMERSGTGQLFMDFAMSITGRQAGGPGKVAVVSSSLFGTVSGSAVRAIEKRPNRSVVAADDVRFATTDALAIGVRPISAKTAPRSTWPCAGAVRRAMATPARARAFMAISAPSGLQWRRQAPRTRRGCCSGRRRRRRGTGRRQS